MLTFPVLVAFLLCTWKGGLQTLLDELFETLTGQAERTVTKSAVSQARRKLKATAFEALNDLLLFSLDAHWPEVQAFADGNLGKHIVTRPVGRDTRRAARTLGIEGLLDEITFRLIRVRLANGSEEILATSLLDAETYPAAEFSALYHARWGIEEAFKVLKHSLLVEQFTGESPEAIRQDFHAKIFTANFDEALAYSAHKCLPNEKAARYQPN